MHPLNLFNREDKFVIVMALLNVRISMPIIRTYAKQHPTCFLILCNVVSRDLSHA
uniref:Uncharacterized protein n=1 Tax=Arundo donax TaxID=35708 RepID=A0A0A9F662_ARUDO